MVVELATVRPSAPLHRLARGSDPWAYPPWAAADPDGTFGNRWDDPGDVYRVLYACSQRRGCFIEVLSRYRPDPEVAAALAEISGADDSLPPGRLPRHWLDNRTLGSARVDGEFVDIGHTTTLAYLNSRPQARAIVDEYGFDEIDAATIRTKAPRRMTQRLGRLIFEMNEPRFAGVEYASRLGDELINWAIFEDCAVIAPVFWERVDREDPDLVSAMETLNLAWAESGSASNE